MLGDTVIVQPLVAGFARQEAGQERRARLCEPDGRPVSLKRSSDRWPNLLERVGTIAFSHGINQRQQAGIELICPRTNDRHDGIDKMNLVLEVHQGTELKRVVRQMDTDTRVRAECEPIAKFACGPGRLALLRHEVDVRRRDGFEVELDLWLGPRRSNKDGRPIGKSESNDIAGLAVRGAQKRPELRFVPIVILGDDERGTDGSTDVYAAECLLNACDRSHTVSACNNYRILKSSVHAERAVSCL